MLNFRWQNRKEFFLPYASELGHDGYPGASPAAVDGKERQAEGAQEKAQKSAGC